jgi:hypothetical protein
VIPDVDITDLLSQGMDAADTTSGGLWWMYSASGIALITSVIILAFMYIWANLFRNPQMLGMVKMELYEVFATVVIIFLLFGAVAMLDTLTLGFFLPSSWFPAGTTADTTIYEATQNYFLTVGDEMMEWITVGYVVNIQVDQISSITHYTRPSSIGFTSTAFGGFGAPIKQLLNHSMIGVLIAYIINYAQYFTFLFAMGAFLKFYLPAGIFLRCFTPTRRIGGSIIAVTMTMIVVFPILCTLSYVIFYAPGSPMTTFTSFVSDVPRSIYQGFIEVGKTTLFDNPSFTKILLAPLYLVLGIIKFGLGTMSIIILGFAGGIIGRAFLIGYIMPTFNIMMLVQAAKGLSKTIGEEIDISALTRLI